MVGHDAKAEFGGAAGGVVNLVSRSGGNSFHGNGFWFYRTPRLNANEWENNLDNLGKAQSDQPKIVPAQAERRKPDNQSDHGAEQDRSGDSEPRRYPEM